MPADDHRPPTEGSTGASVNATQHTADINNIVPGDGAAACNS